MSHPCIPLFAVFHRWDEDEKEVREEMDDHHDKLKILATAQAKEAERVRNHPWQKDGGETIDRTTRCAACGEIVQPATAAVDAEPEKDELWGVPLSRYRELEAAEARAAKLEQGLREIIKWTSHRTAQRFERIRHIEGIAKAALED